LYYYHYYFELRYMPTVIHNSVFDLIWVRGNENVLSRSCPV